VGKVLSVFSLLLQEKTSQSIIPSATALGRGGLTALGETILAPMLKLVSIVPLQKNLSKAGDFYKVCTNAGIRENKKQQKVGNKHLYKLN